jgi:hypothetical protein
MESNMKRVISLMLVLVMMFGIIGSVSASDYDVPVIIGGSIFIGSIITLLTIRAIIAVHRYEDQQAAEQQQRRYDRFNVDNKFNFVFDFNWK